MTPYIPFVSSAPSCSGRILVAPVGVSAVAPVGVSAENIYIFETHFSSGSYVRKVSVKFNLFY
jgi:hypothetical protein